VTLTSLSRAATLALAITALAGCGSISGMLGLERHVPDETKVVVRPPLTLPPDYNLMPPGTASPVSGDHEGGQTTSDTSAPAKEERGFFGRLFHWDLFGEDSDSTPPKPPAPTSEAPSPGPNIEGTPVAPAPTPPAPTPPASTPPGAASPPPATDTSTPPAPQQEQRGFFGRLFHGDLFGGDSDSTTPKPPAPAIDGAPVAPASAPPAGAATSGSDASPPKN
jgi:hypothetical protein